MLNKSLILGSLETKYIRTVVLGDFSGKNRVHGSLSSCMKGRETLRGGDIPHPADHFLKFVAPWYHDFALLSQSYHVRVFT